jgi:hypothetical protein
MNDDFERKVRGAGVAGWWTLLVAAAVFLVQWVAYLFIMSSRPAWAMSLWGPGVTWEYMQHVWWLGAALLKGLLLILAIPCLWLTLWARQLRKAGGA